MAVATSLPKHHGPLAPTLMALSSVTKLALDLSPTLSLRAGMANSTADRQSHELIEQLCTRVGMIMEDVSVIALTISPNLSSLRERVDALERASDQISKLTAAANALLES